MGGSDSDASQATSAVKKSNTPELAEVRPMPALYPPWIENKASYWRSRMCPPIQACILRRTFHGKLGSILTVWLSRSGLGSSGASVEVDEVDVCLFSSQPDQYADTEQSPPTEECDPVEKESSNSIYKRHMYLEAHGLPFWIPQPNMRLSRSYPRQGVSIGDVGIFTSDGGFDFLFNVCLPAGHPSNPNELLEGFSCFVLRPADVSEFHVHASHSYLASPCVKKRE